MERAQVLYASDEARELLDRNGLSDLATIMDRGMKLGHQRHVGRCVWETDLIGEGGRKDRVFVKMQVGRRSLTDRLGDILKGQPSPTFPEREWHGLHLMQHAGLNVASPLALLSQIGRSVRAAVVTRAVPPAQPIGRMLRGPHWRNVAPESRQRLIAEVIQSLDRIHTAGYGWRGASAKHLFPELNSQGQWRVWLIDCEGVHSGATRKTARRDYRRLVESLVKAGLDGPELNVIRQRTLT